MASLWLPRRLRDPVSSIYAFARTADDMADEGELSDAQRLALLEDYGAELRRAERGEPLQDPILTAVADTVRRFELSWSHLHDLLTAFRMDVTRHRYATFDEVLGYCRFSASPVGRLLLELYGEANAENLRRSDAICNALQLINFAQDIHQDYHESNRIYLPADEMRAFGVTEDDIGQRRNSPAMHALLDLQIRRAREMLLAGAGLGRALPGRIGFELRLIVAGGLRVLDALVRQSDVFSRPRLRRRDQLAMLWDAMRG